MKLFYLPQRVCFASLFLINQVLSIPIISPYDEHNCCISCGYTYCPTLLECIREWETECPTGANEIAKLINPFIIDK